MAEWQTAKLSYEDGMIMLSRNNMFQRLSTFRMNSNPESDNTFLEDMTDLLNSRKSTSEVHGILAGHHVRPDAARRRRVHVEAHQGQDAVNYG